VEEDELEGLGSGMKDSVRNRRTGLGPALNGIQPLRAMGGGTRDKHGGNGWKLAHVGETPKKRGRKWKLRWNRSGGEGTPVEAAMMRDESKRFNLRLAIV
jgi:hypothetical protein